MGTAPGQGQEGARGARELPQAALPEAQQGPGVGVAYAWPRCPARGGRGLHVTGRPAPGWVWPLWGHHVLPAVGVAYAAPMLCLGWAWPVACVLC